MSLDCSYAGADADVRKRECIGYFGIIHDSFRLDREEYNEKRISFSLCNHYFTSYVSSPIKRDVYES